MNENGTNERARKAVYFVGDSLTRRCDLDRYYPDFDALNLGISGDTLEEFMQRGEYFKFEKEPDAVVFLMGINDLIFRDAKVLPMKRKYEALFSAWKNNHPQTKVVVQSLYPVIERIDEDRITAWRINDRIKWANSRLKILCEKYGYIYADVHSQLLWICRLDDKYAADCIHVNDEGYKVVARYINSILNGIFSTD